MINWVGWSCAVARVRDGGGILGSRGLASPSTVHGCITLYVSVCGTRVWWCARTSTYSRSQALGEGLAYVDIPLT